MKSKLVRYPFNDGKRYRWDTYQMGKKFEYYWHESKPNNFETITPYIEAIPYDNNKPLYVVDAENPNWANGYSNTITPGEYVAYNARIVEIYNPTIVGYHNEEPVYEYSFSNYDRQDVPLDDTRTSIDVDCMMYVEQDPNTYLKPYCIARFTDTSTGIDYDVQYDPNGTIPTIPPSDFPIGHFWSTRYYAVGKGSCYAHKGAVILEDANEAYEDDTYHNFILQFYVFKDGNNMYFQETYSTLNHYIPEFIAAHPEIEHNYNGSCWVSINTVLGSQLQWLYEYGSELTDEELTEFLYKIGLTECRNLRNLSGIWAVNDSPILSYRTQWGGVVDINHTSRGITITATPMIIKSNMRIVSKDDLDGNGYYTPEYYLEHLLKIDEYEVYPDYIKANINTGISGHLSDEVYYHGTEIPASWDKWNRQNLNMTLEYRDITDELFLMLDPTKPIFYYQWLFLYHSNIMPTTGLNHIRPLYYKFYLSAIVPNYTPTNYLYVDKDTWPGKCRPAYLEGLTPNISYIVKPNIKLIGDNTDNVITVPIGNSEILEYIIGDPVGDELNPKTLLINAPSEYDNNGNVLFTTWLTFNSYTAEEWANGYHFYGNQWNNIASPWAYSSYMTTNRDHHMILVDYQPCDEGIYLNIFSLINATNINAIDTTGNVYGVNSSDYYNNIGALYYFGSGEVHSTNKNAYPVNGYQNKSLYILEPEKTTFIEYVEDTNIVLNVELFKDRYHYTHDNVYYDIDTSLYGTVVGTAQSTNEDSIPNASWKTYLGLYYGDSIPYLNIVEQNIPPSEILGVPTYDKQINTSETLKYGTVASAATTFVLNMPVDDAMIYSNDLLILYYDFKMDDDWTRMGFFYVDSVESIDEYTSRITAHDEAYKLNKYVDRFLEGYSETITIRNFFYELLDYCGCYYDTAMPAFQHSEVVLENIYHAVKTTGTEVAHQIATLVPAFIHADIDSDIVIDHYRTNNTNIGVDKYTELTYCAYNSDIVDKVKITSSNNVVAEDTHTGENVYYLSDNPLLNMSNQNQLQAIANGVWAGYTSIPQYRPATIKFLYIPEGVMIGYSFIVTTPTNQTYRVLVMAVKIDASGITMESYGTQQYPVEASGNSEFVNILNELSGDIGTIDDTTVGLARIVNQTSREVDALQTTVGNLGTTVSSLSTRMGTAEGNITTTASTVSTIQNTVNAMSVSSASNLASITINSNTVSQIALKAYVDNKVSDALIYSLGVLVYRDDDETLYTQNVMYIGNSARTYGIFTPIGYGHGDGGYLMYKVENTSLYGMAYQGDYQGQIINISFWANLHGWSFTPNS